VFGIIKIYKCFSFFSENKIIKTLQEEKEPNQILLHHFCMLCQSISHIHNFKSNLFPDFATKYFQQHKNKFITILDLTFLTDAFTKMKIHIRDIYKYVEKQINEKIEGLPMEICDQLLVSAQRRYENFSMVFLSFLATRFDKLYQIQSNLEGLKAGKAIQLINLMNVVKEKNRTSKFEVYDDLISLVEAESLKEKEKKEDKKEENKGEKKEGEKLKK